MGDTAISYATKGWNPVVGCPLPLASDGCQHCWARELHNRRHRAYRHGKHLPKMYDYPFELMQTFPARLDEPLHWRKPQTVAVCFQGDLFHEAVPEAFIHEVLDTVLCCDQHTFQVLTKRADRCRTVLTKYWDAMREKRRQAETWCDYRGIRFTDSAMPLSSSFTTDFFLTSALIEIPYPNLWVGISCEDRATADARIPLLLQTPAAVRFVSVEPMLGPVDLRMPSQVTRSKARELARKIHATLDEESFQVLDWVILGGESGPQAREMNIEWARSVKNQCVAAGVPFFYKQGPGDVGRFVKMPLLDGQEWRKFPK